MADKVIFLAIDAFGQHGGIQRFNQRIIGCLQRLAAAGKLAPHVNVIRDTPEEIPADLRQMISTFSGGKRAFIARSVRTAHQYDTVLVGHVNLLPIAWMMKAVNPRLKAIMFVHGDEVWNDPKYRLRKRYEPWMMQRIDRVASVSGFTAEIMAREFSVPEDRFTIFPNTVEPPVPFVRESGLPPMILTVSRMAAHDHEKRIDTVLKAVAMLPPAFADTRLEIIGDGVLRPELEALAGKLGIRDRVIFHGRVTDEALDDAYRRASVFALPSAKEGFGIVYLEAWRYKLPAICSSEGASSEIVENEVDGYVVPPDDPRVLADRFTALLGDEARVARLGEAGAQKVVDKYLTANLQANFAALLGVA